MPNINVPLSEKQELVVDAFRSNGVTFIGYGGARKGGKSWIGRHEMLERRLMYPGTYGLITRKTEHDVITNHRDKIHEAATSIFGLKRDKDYSYNEQDATFTFHCATRNGIASRLYLGHLKDLSAAGRYIGNPYLDMMFDEATQIPEEVYLYVLGSLANEYYPETAPKVFACTNPGNENDKWFHNHYVNPFTRMEGTVWIKALPTDNPFFMQTDPGFLARMRKIYANQPWRLRQWLDGSWSASPDKYFEFDEDSAIPDDESGFKRAYWGETVAGVDYGYNKSAFAVVYAHKWRDHQGKDRLHVFSEIQKYRLHADQQATFALKKEEDLKIRTRRRWGDPAIMITNPAVSSTVDHNVMRMWSRHGWHVRPSTKTTKHWGLCLMNMLLSEGVLTISTECKALIGELQDAKYSKDKYGKTLDVTDPNQDDDMSDSLRFLVLKEYGAKYQKKLQSQWEENRVA